jgi:hypothetical protein
MVSLMVFLLTGLDEYANHLVAGGLPCRDLRDAGVRQFNQFKGFKGFNQFNQFNAC